MINPNATAIEYAAQGKLMDLATQIADEKRRLVINRLVGQAARIRYYLKALDDKYYLSDDEVNQIYQCLIVVADINHYPSGQALGERPAPSYATGLPGPAGPVGPQGPQGADGDPGLNWRGAWDSLTPYLINDVVQRNGSSYVAVTNNTTSPPPSGAWELLAAKGNIGPDGPAGADGADGADGATGPQGIQGLTGNTGPQGLTGPQGPKGMVWRGTWSILTNYNIDDTVEESGTSYIAIAANTGQQPPDTLYWNIVARRGTDGVAGADGADGTNGVDGQDAFVYIGYASDTSGTGFSTTPSPALNFINFVRSTSPLTPNVTDFTDPWVPYQGNGDRWTTTSNTSLTIGTGTKSLFVEPALSYSVGQTVVIADAGNPLNSMYGTVISYNGVNGALVADVSAVSGSGTLSVWAVSLQGSPGTTGYVAFSNTDVDTGTEVCDQYSTSFSKGVRWDYVVEQGSNKRIETMLATWVGATVEYTQYSTLDIGSTTDIVFSVDVNSGNARLLATAASDNWIVTGKRYSL